MIFDSDCDYIGPYLRFLADRVGLRDWTIDVADSPPEDESLAATAAIPQSRKWITIAFATSWMNEREEAFRQTCVHELLHAHFEDIWHPLNTIQGYIGEQLYIPAYEGMQLHIEHAIDAIADEWSRLLPLPSEWLELATEPEDRICHS